MAHDVDKILVDHAAFNELHDRDEEPLFVDLGGVGAEASAADVDHMGGTAEVSDEPVPAEHRGDDGEVVEVSGALPRVVGDVGVTFIDAVGSDVLDEVGHRGGHGVHVARGTSDRLSDHAPFDVIDAGGKVPGLPDAGTERRAYQGQGLFLDDRDETVPHHLVAEFAHQPDSASTGSEFCRVINRHPSACRTA